MKQGKPLQRPPKIAPWCGKKELSYFPKFRFDWSPSKGRPSSSSSASASLPSHHHGSEQKGTRKVGQLLPLLPPLAKESSDFNGRMQNRFNPVVSAENLNIPFPDKLHAMLDDADVNSFTDIVSWEEDGHAFKVHDSERFVNTILPRYFCQTRYKSFQRQLNIYGFTRETKGTLKGLCRHKMFIRGQYFLCMGMQRTKIKESSLRGPDFLHSPTESFEDRNHDTHDAVPKKDEGDSKQPQQEEEEESSSKNRGELALFEGRPFYVVGNDEQDSDGVALTSDDMIRVLSHHEETSSSRNSSPCWWDDVQGEGDGRPSNLSSTASSEYTTGGTRNVSSFPWKLYDMLEEVEKSGRDDDIISWECNGRAIRVHKPKEFAEKLLPAYFLHSTRWESFQRQLNLYGFIRVTRGPHKGVYLHKYFIRGQRSLCERISRSK